MLGQRMERSLPSPVHAGLCSVMWGLPGQTGEVV